MTALLDRAIAAARRLPPEAQDEITREVLLLLAGEEVEAVALSPDERAAVAVGRAAAARGDLVPEAEVRSLLARHGT